MVPNRRVAGREVLEVSARDTPVGMHRHVPIYLSREEAANAGGRLADSLFVVDQFVDETL
jgi:hypothetical protein